MTPGVIVSIIVGCFSLISLILSFISIYSKAELADSRIRIAVLEKLNEKNEQAIRENYTYCHAEAHEIRNIAQELTTKIYLVEYKIGAVKDA